MKVIVYRSWEELSRSLKFCCTAASSLQSTAKSQWLVQNNFCYISWQQKSDGIGVSIRIIQLRSPKFCCTAFIPFCSQQHRTTAYFIIIKKFFCKIVVESVKYMPQSNIIFMLKYLEHNFSAGSKNIRSEQLSGPFKFTFIDCIII